MKLTPPTKATFWISVVLGVLGLLGALGMFLGDYATWLLLAAWIVVMLGLLVKGM